MNTALAGGLAALPLSCSGPEVQKLDSGARKPDYARLDEVLKKPVLKRELFPSPVIIETLELLWSIKIISYII